MASKTMIIVIVLLGVSISSVSSVSSTHPPTSPPTTSTTTVTTAPTTGTTTAPTTGTTPNDTTAVDMTTSTSQTQPTPTTSNDTTEPQTTTVPPTTSILTTQASPEIGTWTVVAGAKNQTCMKMSFKGTITQTNVDPILIPTTAAADPSSCNDDESDFVLQFKDENMIDISVTLSFVMQNKETSYLYSSSITYNNQTTVPDVQVLFATPVGNSYQCNKQMISLGAAYNLTLEDLRLQPFASFANHDFGKAYSCVSPPSGPNAAVIVGLVLGAIILILVIAVVVLYRKKKGPGRGYNNFS